MSLFLSEELEQILYKLMNEQPEHIVYNLNTEGLSPGDIAHLVLGALRTTVSPTQCRAA